jgi:hypothetical protein
MITVEAKKVGARVIATVKVGIGAGTTPIRSSSRIKEVRLRTRPRRSASCAELLKKSLPLLAHPDLRCGLNPARSRGAARLRRIQFDHQEPRTKRTTEACPTYPSTRQLSVPDRVLYRAVAEPILDSSGVMSGVRNYA